MLRPNPTLYSNVGLLQVAPSLKGQGTLSFSRISKKSSFLLGKGILRSIRQVVKSVGIGNPSILRFKALRMLLATMSLFLILQPIATVFRNNLSYLKG